MSEPTSELHEERLSSESVYSGKMLQVRRDQVRTADGHETVREWVEHPGAAAIVPLFEDGTTLMVHQHRYPVGKTLPEVPAGKLDKDGENPEEVARRELEEETGYRAERFTKLGALHPTIGYSDEVIHYFLAEGLQKGEFAPERGESLEPFSIGFEEAVRRAREGEFQDMKTVVALLLADDHLRRRAEEVRGKNVR